MRTKYWSTLLATGLLGFAAMPAFAESSPTPEMNFSCQVKNGVPTTVARETESNNSISVFHWRSEALPESTDAQQACDRVSAKLADYSSQGYDLSTIGFASSQVAGLPSICATAGRDCNVILLTLSPDVNREAVDTANQVLTGILDKKLQGNKITFEGKERGVQSITYQVNIWSLLGLQKLIK